MNQILQPPNPFRLFGTKIIRFEKIDSTNAYAKSIAEEAEEGTVILADEQSAGRGRFARSWISEPGKNLLFSIILKPRLPADRIALLSLAAGIAVALAIEEVSGLKTDCKWPNDILIDGKKVCGILAESSFARSAPISLIIGIGLNVNQLNFPKELQSTASSISLIAGKVFDRDLILNSILEQLELLYLRIGKDESDYIIQSFKARCAMLGNDVTIQSGNESIQGIASDIDRNGALMITTTKGIRKVLAGDVTFKRR